MPTGTEVFDWTVPREWNIRDAYVKDAAGRARHRLRDVQPARRQLQRPGAADHDARPSCGRTCTRCPSTRTGFPTGPPTTGRPGASAWPTPTCTRCRTATTRCASTATLADGHLTYGESGAPGETEDEVLISATSAIRRWPTTTCRASRWRRWLAKSLGRCVAALLATASSSRPGRSARSPGSPRNEASAARIKHGLVLTGARRRRARHLQASRRGEAEIDRVARARAARRGATARRVVDFTPYGYDERQFCSPGFDLPVGCLMRTPYGEYPEYHTSADDLGFVRPEALADSFFKLPVGDRRSSRRTGPTST